MVLWARSKSLNLIWQSNFKSGIVYIINNQLKDLHLNALTDLYLSPHRTVVWANYGMYTLMVQIGLILKM